MPVTDLSSAGVLCSFSISIDLLETILTRPGSPFTICWVFPNKSSFNWNSLQQKQVSNLSSWFLPSHFSFFICTRTRTSTPGMCYGPSVHKNVSELFILHSGKTFWYIYQSFLPWNIGLQGLLRWRQNYSDIMYSYIFWYCWERIFVITASCKQEVKEGNRHNKLGLTGSDVSHLVVKASIFE